MLTRLFKQGVHVKPLRANDDHTQWLVIWHSPIQAFFDDLMRYGSLSLALCNLKRQLYG
jgi:hypothetical protein